MGATGRASNLIKFEANTSIIDLLGTRLIFFRHVEPVDDHDTHVKSRCFGARTGTLSIDHKP